MYKEMYNEYNPEDFQFCSPFCFNDSYKYLDSQNQPEYAWNYGDTVNIPFLINSPYNQSDYTIIITLYDFRHEPVFAMVGKADSYSKVYLTLTTAESKKYFKKSIYFCGVQACKNYDTDEEEMNTIMPEDACQIHVR